MRGVDRMKEGIKAGRRVGRREVCSEDEDVFIGKKLKKVNGR